MKNIWKLIIISFLTSLYFFTPILTLFLQGRGLNLFQIVSLESILIAALFISEVPTGMIGDKFGRKNSIIISMLFLLLQNILFVIAKSYWMFALSFILAGIGYAFSSGSVEALVYDTLKKDKKEKSMNKVWGKYMASGKAAAIIAPLIGGYVARSFTEKAFLTTIYMYIGVAFIAFLMTFTLKEHKHYKKIKQSSLFLLKDSIKLIKTNNNLRRIIYLSILTSPFYHVLLLTFQPYFINAKVPNILFGIALFGGNLLAFIGSGLAYKTEEKLGLKKSVLLATILPGILYLSMAFTYLAIPSFVLFILVMGVMSLKEPLFAQYKNIHISSHNRATVLSIISMITAFYLIFMRLLLGYVADISLSLMFGIMGGLIILGSIALRIDEKHLEIK